jgi:hypothetical protein
LISGGAISGALLPKNDPDFARVATSWPKLEADAKAMILRIVEDGVKQGLRFQTSG